MAHANPQSPPPYSVMAAPSSPVRDAPPKYAVNDMHGFEDGTLTITSFDGLE